MTKVSLHKEFVLVETDVIDLTKLREGKISIMYYIVEIHNTENDDIGVLMHEEAGEQTITKFDSWSKAKVQAELLSKQLQPNLSTKIVSFEDTHDSTNL